MKEKREEKREKRNIYDGINISERVLNTFIVFAIVALSLVIICGYFMGNYTSSRESGNESISSPTQIVYSI